MDINADLGKPAPVYLNRDSSDFVQTSNGKSIFRLKDQEMINIFCSSGFKTPLDSSRKKKLLATCISGTDFNISGTEKPLKLKDVACNKRVTSGTKTTSRTCVAGPTIEIGFDAEG